MRLRGSNFVSLLLSVIVVTSGHADITLWSGNSADVDITQGTRSVVIEAAGTFKFQSVTAGALDIGVSSDMHRHSAGDSVGHFDELGK